MLPKEIFLSHASADMPFATSLTEMLRRHGLPIWYSPSNLLGAEEWHDEVGEALERCDWFVIVLSPNAIRSMWVKRELVFALQQERLVKKIVPLIYRPCNSKRLSWTFTSFQSVDFTQSFDEGCAALLRIWGIGYQKSS